MKKEDETESNHFFFSLGAVEDSWDTQSISPWWQQVRCTCIQSHNAAAALLAAFVAHRAAKASISSRADSKVESHTHTFTRQCHEKWSCAEQELFSIGVF